MGADTTMLRVAVTLEQCWHRVPGGTARAALDTVRAVRRHGGVELVGVAAKHRTTPDAPWNPPIPTAMLPLPRNALYESWHRFGRPSVERATGPVDVIHVTGLAMPPRSTPIVATLHDLAFVRHPDYFTRNGLRFFDAAMRRMRRDADLVLCSSRATLEDALDAGFDRDRLRVVPLGVDAPIVDAERIRAVRRRFDLHGRYVLHLGTAEPRKNAAALMRIESSLPDDVTVVFAGGAGWGDIPGVTPDPARRRVNVGFVSEVDKWGLLAGASVFCFPSFWEGFGLPVLEAMAVSTPVVTSSGTALAEVVGDAGLLVDPHDDAELATAVNRILADPGLAGDLSERGRERAGEFTWERTGRSTIAAYREASER
ncbi:MAG: glycosyltransferase family 4 protein [Actinobacteria bacterium]|nr:glycosyltransferase family 4 protein [Actinomycetota bacterium]